MLYNTLVFSAIAAFTASARAANSCAAGAIIGINAVCGNDAEDCGSGRCCLADQQCVGSGTSIACADSSLQTGTTLTVNAGCYGTSGPESSNTSGFGSTQTTNPATVATPNGAATAKETGTGGSSTEMGSHPSNGSYTGTGSESDVTSAALASPSSKGSNGSTIAASAVLSPYTFTNATIGSHAGATNTGSGPKSTSKISAAQSSSATSAFTSPQNSIAVVLSAIAIVALWL